MEPSPINQKQRDDFARMLEQAKARAQAELESDGDLSSRLEREVLPKLAEEKSAMGLITKVRKLRQEVEETEGALQDLGFECSRDTIKLTWKAPKSLTRVLEAAKRSARQENLKSLRKFDLAILGVWTAETAEDARMTVEGLL